MRKIHPIKDPKERRPSEVLNELNIRSRKCEKFQPNQNDEEDEICVCNRDKDPHTEKEPTKEFKWKMHHCTVENIQPEHGLILNEKPYVRLALDTPVEKVEKILFEAWKISKPRLIMSIIGGMKHFLSNDRLETNFIKEIIDVALKSNAWILTNGYNVGLVQLVGQAIQKVKLTQPDQTIPTIAICKWGCITDLEVVAASKQEKNTKTSASNAANQQGRRVGGEWPLEMNHSHYLMLDDGTIHNYNTENYRTRLTVQLGKLEDENDFPRMYCFLKMPDTHYRGILM